MIHRITGRDEGWNTTRKLMQFHFIAQAETATHYHRESGNVLCTSWKSGYQD